MVILGIDPGFTSLGWALLDLSDAHPGPHCIGAGVIRTKPDNTIKRCDDNVRRIGILAGALRKLQKENDCILIAAEAQSWTSFQKPDRAVAMAWGIIGTIGEIWAIPVLQFRPQEIKKAICNDASASKKTLENALGASIGGAFEHLACISKTQRNHAADALGAAVTSLDHDMVKMMENMRAYHIRRADGQAQQ